MQIQLDGEKEAIQALQHSSRQAHSAFEELTNTPRRKQPRASDTQLYSARQSADYCHSELNEQLNIRPTPNGTYGVQQSLRERLDQWIHHLLHVSPPDARLRTSLTLQVKLTGDGTNIGKKLHVINFGFMLLEGVLA